MLPVHRCGVDILDHENQVYAMGGTFPLRVVKESPPYLDGGRLLTEVRLTDQEKLTWSFSYAAL